MNTALKFCLTALACCIGAIVQAQHSFEAIIKGERELNPLVGATVVWNEGKQILIADTAGRITINSIPEGTQSFSISCSAYEIQMVTYTFPLKSNARIEIYLKAEHEE